MLHKHLMTIQTFLALNTLIINKYYIPDAWVGQQWKGRQHEGHHLQQNRLCTYRSRCQRPGQRFPHPWLNKKKNNLNKLIKSLTVTSISCKRQWRLLQVWRPASRGRKGAGLKPSDLRQRKWSGSLTIALYGNKFEQFNAADSARGIRPTDTTTPSFKGRDKRFTKQPPYNPDAWKS